MPPSDKPFSALALDEAQRQLADLVAHDAAITLALLTSADGFEIASHPRHSAHTQRLAAMSSSLQALSAAMVQEAGLADSRNLIIQSADGAIVVLGIAGLVTRVSLAVIAAGDVNLGSLLWASRNCCTSLERSLRS